jgi:tRNA uracil 4-sulfurtransferase
VRVPHFFIIRLSGDLYTKARKTRLRFLQRLGRNLEDALAAHGMPYRLERTWSRFYLETPDPGAPAVVARVFGVQSVSAVERRPWERLEDVVRAGVELFVADVAGRSFAVRASRRGERDRIGFDSQAVEVALGRALLAAAPGSTVDLAAPEAVAHVELEPGMAHLFAAKLPGRGGLPVGVEGRAVALVSGGFDSAVASWLMLKRGVQLDYVFCNLGGEAHRLGALRVMKVIADRWSYGTRPRLHELDFQPLAAEIQAKALPRHWQLLLKRLMLQAGERLALRGGAAGLVTGDAVGQVSSQTLQNLAVVSQAARALPLLRPLLGFNKDEILALARQAGFHDPAAAVKEYCALVPRRPATRAALADVLREEAALDLDLLQRAVAGRRMHDLRGLDPDALAPSHLAIDHLPAGATLIDLRSAAAFRAWHYPGALHLDFARALAAYGSLPRDRAYVLVCEVGLKSADLAERMQRQGLSAHHLQGGVKELMALAERERLLAPALLAPAVRQ